MTITPLTTPYNGDTHVSIELLELSINPPVVHFRRGTFAAGTTLPTFPYSADTDPAGWTPRAELNTANLPYGLTTLTDVVTAIDSYLQANA